jgi:hypothetical protein
VTRESGSAAARRRRSSSSECPVLEIGGAVDVYEAIAM